MRPICHGLMSIAAWAFPGALWAVTPVQIDPSACVGVTAPVARADCLINDVRARNAMGALVTDAALVQAAHVHNQDMYIHGFFGHTGSDGSNFIQRIMAAGFAGTPTGELIGMGYQTADSVVQAWLDDPPHRAFLLAASANRSGIDFIPQSPVLWTMEMGTHSGAGVLKGLTLKSQIVAGCKSVAGTVTLYAASASDVVATLGDTLGSATVPATVRIAAGSTSASFTIKTSPVPGNEVGVISASVGQATATAPLTVRPMGLSSVTLTPPAVVGGTPVTGTATLECKAAPAPVRVDLSGSNTFVAQPVAAFVYVPQGMQTASFDITTSPVEAKVAPAITATAGGITRSKPLTVSPAAAVSPTSLAFDYQRIGTTSYVQVANLYNRGTSSFVVTGITIAGTYASQFAQVHNCPASLPAGGYCTIGVTFKPVAAGARSAKLTVATSATAAPLAVSLTGTGY